jgi:hypothetical protein
MLQAAVTVTLFNTEAWRAMSTRYKAHWDIIDTLMKAPRGGHAVWDTIDCMLSSSVSEHRL